MAEVPVSEPTKEEVPLSLSIESNSRMRPPNYSFIDTVMRVLLFSASLVAVVVMVTAKQTEMVQLPTIPISVPREAKFDQSPAFIYFVAALSVSGLYSILTALASVSVMLKPLHSKKFTIHFAFWDAIMLGIVAAATGTAGGVAYIGLKGNSHTGWNELCNIYDKYCQHVASSIAMSLLASILLVLLIMLSTFSLYKRSPE